MERRVGSGIRFGISVLFFGVFIYIFLDYFFILLSLFSHATQENYKKPLSLLGQFFYQHHPAGLPVHMAIFSSLGVIYTGVKEEFDIAVSHILQAVFCLLTAFFITCCVMDYSVLLFPPHLFMQKSARISGLNDTFYLAGFYTALCLMASFLLSRIYSMTRNPWTVLILLFLPLFILGIILTSYPETGIVQQGGKLPATYPTATVFGYDGILLTIAGIILYLSTRSIGIPPNTASGVILLCLMSLALSFRGIWGMACPYVLLSISFIPGLAALHEVGDILVHIVFLLVDALLTTMIILRWKELRGSTPPMMEESKDP